MIRVVHRVVVRARAPRLLVQLVQVSKQPLRRPRWRGAPAFLLGWTSTAFVVLLPPRASNG